MKPGRVWDDGGKSADRYTVEIIGDPYGGYLALGDTPDSPNGFSQYGEAWAKGPHLGKEITFAELPDNVQAHALRRLADDE